VDNVNPDGDDDHIEGLHSQEGNFLGILDDGGNDNEGVVLVVDGEIPRAESDNFDYTHCYSIRHNNLIEVVAGADEK